MSCASCGDTSLQCKDAFLKHGVHTVHWECWSACNLQCDFCYRSLRGHLDTSDAIALIESLAFGGVSRLIFAGGDPSLRQDLELLCRRGVDLGLNCEIQTNAQALTSSLSGGLHHASRLYLSLDGATAAAHDAFRSKRGNFAGVARLLQTAQSRNLPVTVHSVASRQNWRELPGILTYIRQFLCVDTWSVLEFSPSGAGYATRDRHEMSADSWNQTSDFLREAKTSRPRLALLGVGEKKGLYAMVSSDGYAYRAAESRGMPIPDAGRIGSLLKTHLSDIARAWRIDATRHARRYASS